MDIQAALVDVGEKMVGWGHSLILMLPNFVAASIVVLLAFALSRVLRHLVSKAMLKATSQPLLTDLMATVAQGIVILVGLFVALGILKLDKTVTSLLAGAGVIGLALAFAFQDIVSNFLSGILLAVRRPFSPGDIIKTNDFQGTVDELNLRATHLRTPEGQVVILPNALVFQNPLTNFSMARSRRVDITCGVGYDDDLELAEKLAIEAVSSLEMSDRSRAIDLYYNAFGDSAIEFTIRFWIAFDKQTDYLKARSLAIKAIKKAFDKAGVNIPFPIRTIDFGSLPLEKLPVALREGTANGR